MKKRSLLWLWIAAVILNLVPLALAVPSARHTVEWAGARLAKGQDVPYESWEWETNLAMYFQVYVVCGLSASLVVALSSVVIYGVVVSGFACILA
jgi:phage terminase large subunit GpA-like protein